MLKALGMLATGLLLASQAQAWCWMEAGQRYNVDPYLLYAIAKQESGLNPKALNKNRNGTIDIGLMQINSTHLPTLAKFNISREALNEPCTNIMVGAWVLASSFSKKGVSWYNVGDYNVGGKVSPERDKIRVRYANSVYRHYQKAIKDAMARANLQQ